MFLFYFPSSVKFIWKKTVRQRYHKTPIGIYLSTKLHCITSQRFGIFVFTFMGTWDPIWYESLVNFSCKTFVGNDLLVERCCNYTCILLTSFDGCTLMGNIRHFMAVKRYQLILEIVYLLVKNAVYVHVRKLAINNFVSIFQNWLVI